MFLLIDFFKVSTGTIGTCKAKCAAFFLFQMDVEHFLYAISGTSGYRRVLFIHYIH